MIRPISVADLASVEFAETQVERGFPHLLAAKLPTPRSEKGPMESIFQDGKSGMQVMLIRGLGSERDQAEAELCGDGIPLALSDRAVWAAHHGWLEPKFLLARDANGKACGGCAIEEVRSRALPGHKIFKVRRFGNGLPALASEALLRALAAFAKKDPRVLFLQLNRFSREELGELAGTLQELGFHAVEPPSSYRHTLVINTKMSEEEAFASFTTETRNRIRKALKKSLKCIPITEREYANRLRELQMEALQRTDGQIRPDDWPGILKFSQKHPNLSCVFGLFLSEDIAPGNMVAFSWVLNNGDHGEYRSAGSTRRIEAPVPLGYLPVWEMIRWAIASGAEWFDMGGVTVGDGDQSALEGISRFKRAFCRDIVEVGSEWVLETSPGKARFAGAVSHGSRRLRGMIRKWRQSGHSQA